jgi:hypothetical protein
MENRKVPYINCYAYFTDADGDSLTFSANVLIGGSWVSLPSGIFLISNPWVYINSESTADIGTYTIQVTASDSISSVVASSFTVTITAQTIMFNQIANMTIIHR